MWCVQVVDNGEPTFENSMVAQLARQNGRGKGRGRNSSSKRASMKRKPQVRALTEHHLNIVLIRTSFLPSKCTICKGSEELLWQFQLKL